MIKVYMDPSIFSFQILKVDWLSFKIWFSYHDYLFNFA